MASAPVARQVVQRLRAQHDEQDRRVAAEVHRKRARRLTVTLAELGPTFIKLAQVFASRADILRGQYDAALKQLDGAKTSGASPAAVENLRARLGRESRQHPLAEWRDRDLAAIVLDRTAFYPTSGGQPHDTGTLGGAPVTSGSKSGFCPEDTGGGGQRRYSCLTDYRMGPAGPEQVVGISAGAWDTYRMHLPDQYLEITGVPDGRYVLEIELDPNDNVAESNERDNLACIVIGLKGDDAHALGSLPC